MPSFGGNPRPAPLPPPPRSVGPPILPPPPPSQHAAVAAQQAVQAQQQQAAAYRAPSGPVLAPQQTSRPNPGGDVQSGGGYGTQSAQANAFKNTPAYRQAIVDTFLHQPKPQALAIVKGALTSPSFEGGVVLHYLDSKGLSASLSGGQVKLGFGALNEPGLGGLISKGLDYLTSSRQTPLGQVASETGAVGPKSLGDFATRGISYLATPRQTPLDQIAAETGAMGPGSLGHKLVGGATSLINQLPTGTGAPPGIVGPTAIAAVHGGMILPTAGGLAKNFAKGAINYVPNTIQATAGLVKDVAQGQYGAAAHALGDPYVQFAKHPAATAYNDPFNTAMLVGGVAGPLRGTGTLMRRGVFGQAAARAASTARTPLELGPGTGIYEARSYSPTPTSKAVQVLHEKAVRSLGHDPNVARQSMLPPGIARSLNIGLDAKLARIAHEMTSVHQMASRGGRGQGVKAINEARPKNAAGQNIVAHILQRVIRRPDTAIADINKEIARLEAVRTDKRTLANVQNKRQVASLQAAKKDPAAITQAFASAGKIGDWLNTRDEYLAQRALIEPDQALRSKLFPYAQAHMNAKYDFGGSPTKEALAYRAARATEAKAAARAQEATAALAEAQRQHSSVTGRTGGEAQGAVRGRADVASRALTQRALGRVQERLAAAQDALRTAKADHVSARSARVELNAHAKATAGPRLVGPSGNELTNDAILAHMKENGVPEPAYVGHYPGKTNSSNFYMAYRAARGSKQGIRRTGEAFRQGSYDHSFGGLVAQAARTEQVVTRAGLHDHIVNRLGIAKPEAMQNPHDPTENGLFTAAEAQRFVHAYSHDKNGDPIPGRPELTALTAGPARDLHAIKDLQHPSELHNIDNLELQALERATNDATLRGRKEGGPRNVVAVPKVAMDAFREQFAPGSRAGRRMGAVTQQFRRTVLPYSTHWMTQIVTEAMLRGVVHNTYTPLNIAMGRRLWSELQHTPEGQRVLMESVNGTFFNAHDPLARVNPNPGAISRAAHVTPVVKHILAAHNAYADTIGASMKFLETQARVSGLGKLAHQELVEHPVAGFTHAWQKSAHLQGEVVSQLASRLKADPALVAKFGRSIDATFGQYNKFGPTLRGAVQSVAPFLPWYLNAARFTFYLLPFKHPVTSSLLASLRQTLEQDIKNGKAEPLSKFVVDALARFTPFGIVGPNTVDTFATPLVPEFAGAWNVAHGQNVFGDAALKGPGGVVTDARTRAGLAAYTVLESILPGLRIGRSVMEGGGTSYGTSTIVAPQTKPNTGSGFGRTLNKVLNPLRAAGVNANPRTSSGSGGGGGGWGGPASGGGGGWGPAATPAPSGGGRSAGGWG